MRNLLNSLQSLIKFLRFDLWRVRTSRLSSRHGFFVKFIRVLILSFKGFKEDKCLSKASSLTYFTLFSIVPVIALVFAIAKGFGLEEKLRTDLLQDFNEHREVLNKIFIYAHSMLENAKGGVIAGFGILLLLWSVMNLLSNIEASFNEIWEVRKGRSMVRKFTDYLSIMLIAPIFIILSGSITVVIKSGLGNLIKEFSWLPNNDFALQILLKLLSLLLINSLFTFLFIVLPNTKVNLKSALIAGFVSAILFEILEWAYISFLVGTVSYNKIYGSFAALPLFLIWVQYSWYVVLLGAEIAFASQHVDNFEQHDEVKNISPRLRKTVSLLIANLVVSNFKNGGKPFNATEVAAKLDLPFRLANTIISELVEVGIFNEVKLDVEKEIGYQPAISDDVLTIGFVLEKLESKGINVIEIEMNADFEKLKFALNQFDSLSNKSNYNLRLGNFQ